jgi:hypothetical protein
MSAVTDPRRRLLAALLLLALVQLAHLLDGLRYAKDAEFPSVLNDPAAIFGVALSLVAFVAVARRDKIARGLAMLAGAAVAVGFVLYHGIPFRLRRNNPYWGPDGHADLIRWLTVLAAIAVGVWTMQLARRMRVTNTDAVFTD